MGYRTRYTIKPLTPGVELDFVLAVLEELDVPGFERWVGSLIMSDFSWYEHEEDMAKLAARFPSTTFQLSGEGEEAGDIWRMYFRHGREPVTQRARVVFDDPPEWANG